MVGFHCLIELQLQKLSFYFDPLDSQCVCVYVVSDDRMDKELVPEFWKQNATYAWMAIVKENFMNIVNKWEREKR